MVNDNCFESLTVFILASNETESLNNTVSRIQALNFYKDINKIVIVLKDSNCPARFEAERILSTPSADKIELYIQKSDSIELCFAELPEMVKTSHFVVMAADEEMEIENIDTFILKAKENPEKIICAAKWHKDSTVHGYGAFREIGSRLVGLYISILFCKKVNDPFSIYQIYPMSVYNKMNYINPKTYGLEYTLKPLRNNIEYEEIPTVYRKRTDNKTNYNFKKLFKLAVAFGFVALKIRFSPKENFASKDQTSKEKERD